MVRIFVYGTLRKGECRHYFLEDSRFIGYARVKGYLLYNLGAYPGMVQGGGEVVGEVYEIPESFLKKLDLVEGVPELYRRELIEVTLENGQTISAYAYIYNRKIDNKLLISSGDWKDVSKVYTD
jgi:gamma-glutamylcyclotransferase (GGCT)/AIG2-like uncharacterized protein YtfP